MAEPARFFAPSDGRWRALLAPWRSYVDAYDVDALGRLHHAVMDEGDRCVDARGVLWFRWTPTTRGADALAQQLELLVLLAALCDHDPRAFESLLGDLGDEYTQFFVETRARYEWPYTFGVYVKIDDDELLAVIKDALLREDEEVSETYKKVCAELRGDCEAPRRVPLFVEFESRGVVPKLAIASSLEMVERLDVAEPEDRRHVIGAAFQVSTVQLDVYDGAQLDVQAMAQLAQLLDAGVRLPFFQFGTPFSSARTPNVLTQTVQTVHALLRPRCVERSADEDEGKERPRLEHLEVTTPMPTSLAVSVCTAIAQSTTLQFLEIDHNMARRFGREQFPMDRCWRWLAYALFSREATHDIQKLEVTAEILSEFNATIIREVLALEDPLLALVDPRGRIESPVKDTFVNIRSGTEISLVYDYTRARKDIAVFTNTSALTGLRVLQEDVETGWVSFVLPGWGECRIQRDLVTLQRINLSEKSESLNRGIPHIRLDYVSIEDIEAVGEFLDVVGPHVRRLDIHEFDYEVHDVCDHIVTFIRKCPNLEMLDLFAVKLETIQPLVDAFSSGDCSIKRFKFRQLRVMDMASMHAFFDTLTEPSHAMTSCLREISFHVFEQTIQDASRGSILFSCVEMLPENTVLQVCRAITMSKKRCTQFASLFDEYDGEPLPTQKGPLALQSKLAFLSVVSTPLHGVEVEVPGLSALRRLDTNVLQTIFKFAAENELRQSSVEVPVRKW